MKKVPICGAGKHLSIPHLPGPLGVCGRNFDNRLMEKPGWKPTRPLKEGLEKSFPWIAEQVRQTVG